MPRRTWSCATVIALNGTSTRKSALNGHRPSVVSVQLSGLRMATLPNMVIGSAVVSLSDRTQISVVSSASVSPKNASRMRVLAEDVDM